MELKLQTPPPHCTGHISSAPHPRVGDGCGVKVPMWERSPIAADSLSDNPSKALPVAWAGRGNQFFVGHLSFLFRPSLSCYLATIWDPMTCLLPFEPLLIPGPGSPVSN